MKLDEVERGLAAVVQHDRDGITAAILQRFDAVVNPNLNDRYAEFDSRALQALRNGQVDA